MGPGCGAPERRASRPPLPRLGGSAYLGAMSDTAADQGNAPAYSVSELSAALKRTLESAYGYVRLRGEISKVTRHGNGHIYLDLKDENACIAGVVWKGNVRGLKAQPEQGLEVIVTGKITTFAPRSSYQIIIDALDLAGQGPQAGPEDDPDARGAVPAGPDGPGRLLNVLPLVMSHRTAPGTIDEARR